MGLGFVLYMFVSRDRAVVWGGGRGCSSGAVWEPSQLVCHRRVIKKCWKMEIKLEVVLSSNIKRRKPWPRFCWLGQEKESVFLLDDHRISEINLSSGRTKKRTPKLQPLLNSAVTMASSSNGVWLAGLLKPGIIFLWNRDKDVLKTTAAVSEVADFISSIQGSASKLSLQVSGDAKRVLLVAVTGQVFLWQCTDAKDLMWLRDGTVRGDWTHIHSSDDTQLPTSHDKEASAHTLFVQTEVTGDICLSTFMFTSGKNLVISFLKITWGENQEKSGSVSFSVTWVSRTFSMADLRPPCRPVKSRGALVSALSPDGQLLAVVLNQRQPQATQVLFVSTINFVSIPSRLGGCGCKKKEIPSKYIRSYWVGSVSWSQSGLFLACVLKRGSLLMLARVGGLLTLSTSGCNVDFGPAHFLPLHPLVTYRPPSTSAKGEASLSSSSLSRRDVMRQRYSVTWHPRLFYFIVSDGYMATVVRVVDKVSPTQLLITLLKETTVDLDRASQLLDDAQKHVKVWLDSVSSLNMEQNLLELNPIDRPTSSHIPAAADRSSLPFFLQDHGTMGNPRDLLSFFEEDSDVEGVPLGSHAEKGGRLEFASMFDTLHALTTQYEQCLESDSERGSRVGIKWTGCDFEKTQSRLLSVWAFAASVGHKPSLLKHAVKCTLRFTALLQLRSLEHTENQHNHMLDFLKKVLHFTPWHRANSEGPQFVGIMVDLCKRLVELVLTPYSDSDSTHSFKILSHGLSTALQILDMFSQSLDKCYTLQQRSVCISVGEDPSEALQLSDLHCVSLLQPATHTHCASPAPVPSRRFHNIWRWLYTVCQKYMKDLENFKDCENWEQEKEQSVIMMCEIQTQIQSTGERLEEHDRLLDCTGENLFLSGFYSESSDVWYSQLMEMTQNGAKRSVFQEKRLCLALLYSLLSQYNLKQAQELGDHMSFLILRSTGNQEESLQCKWLPDAVSADAAYAVVQTLGRFMASYFSNQSLHILPPHNVNVLPPIHTPHASSAGRLVPLCQGKVTQAVRQQQLSQIWTVEFAQDLLLLGGLFPEAVWLASHVGDWKAAVSLSQGYLCYCNQHFDFTGLGKRELHLPKDLEPASILQAELTGLLGNGDAKEQIGTNANQSFSDPVGEEDWGVLHGSVQDILKASVMAQVDAVSSSLSFLMDKAKDLSSCLTVMVPTELYLPAPPLYCPQPSPNTQDPAGSLGHHTEVSSRHKISEVVQKLLLLLRAANCCTSAAQWYLSKLRRTRHVLFKMKKKYCCPDASQEEKSFPEGLLKFLNRSGHFKWGPTKTVDQSTIQTMNCFRELCGLCWMLHVRDQLSLSCRKYQVVRQKTRDDQEDVESRAAAADALLWARRLLPFSRFLNCEETIQDTILSLLSELPPVSLVADTLALSFPKEEESVRVSLRGKYNTILRTLTGSSVVEDGEEPGRTMMLLIQDKLRLRRKHFGRLRRHLFPLETHLWQKETEEEEQQETRGKHGTSRSKDLSPSTMSNCGLVPVLSDADSPGPPVSPRLQTKTSRTKKTSKKRDRDRRNVKSTIKRVKKERPSGVARSAVKPGPLPPVGSWEFELEDEEYLNFLELFLGYLLEKDSPDTNEFPLLRDFSHELREKELHSLAFDVLTTLNRRQRDGHPPERRGKNSEHCFFRAGSCFRPITQDASLNSAVCSQSLLRNSSSALAPLATAASSHKGLFSRLKRRRERSQTGSGSSPVRTTESLRFCSVVPVVELLQDLNAEFEARFPELGRLLEWMMRWADRRRPLGKSRGETNADGVVLRLKATTPAVLTSLWLMEQRYSDTRIGTDLNRTQGHRPQTQWVVAPVLQIRTGQKVEQGSSSNTGSPVRTNTTAAALHSNTRAPALHSDTTAAALHSDTTAAALHSDATAAALHSDATAAALHSDTTAAALHSDATAAALHSDATAAVLHSDTTAPHSNTTTTALRSTIETIFEDHRAHAPDPPHPDSTSRASPSLPEHVNLTPDVDDTDRFSSTSSDADTPGASFKLEDLHISPNHTTSAILKPKSPPHMVTDERVVDDGCPNLQSSSSGPDAAHLGPSPAAPSGPWGPSDAQTPQMRQRLGADLYRLVQNINYVSLMEVLGASFSNLQLVQQQNASLAQSNLNTSGLNIPPPPTAPPFPPSHSQPHPPEQVTFNSTEIQHGVHRNPPSTPSVAYSNASVVTGTREMAQLYIQAGSPTLPPPAASWMSGQTSPQLQLLKDDSQRDSVHHDSVKRQKRREKLRKEETEVTFRPNDSIIPQEATDDPQRDQLRSETEQDHPSPPGGSKQPLLSGAELLEKYSSTSAELHVFALTCRSPPQTHDAFTNTDPDPSLHEEVVSSDVGTEPQGLSEQHTAPKSPVRDQLTKTTNLDLDGRQFVSVVDLEDESRHQDLPLCPSLRSALCTDATTAELHVRATRVLQNAADSQTKDTIHARSTTPEIHSEASVSHHPLVLEVHGEDSAAESSTEITRTIRTLPLLSRSETSSQPTVWFSSQMSQLDSQLTSLQRVADSLESDLSKSRMLVNSAGNLTHVSTSEKKPSTGVKKTVRLFAPLERQTPPHGTTLPHGTKPELSPSEASRPQTAGRLQDTSELSNLSDLLGDETLEEAGLCDTAEILEQLVREGFLSPSDLDFNTTDQSRQEVEEKAQMWKRRDQPQNDRQELKGWMRRKQRERLAVYQKHRQNLREREHRPFSSNHTAKRVNKNTDVKWNRDSARVLEHYNQRTIEACSLADGLSAGASTTLGFCDTSRTFTARSSALPFDRTFRIQNTTSNKNSLENPRPVLSDQYHKRLGIDRPVTSLPRDRLSQVTRRGMVTCPKSSPTSGAGDDRRKRKSLWEREYPAETDGGREVVGGLDVEEEEEEDDEAVQWDWLDNLSETGSNISRIDWAAIEKMVAEET
uniref:Uncharacterized protein n=1 Tax=Knipowitschia caucasica TaxID=637954 RepID=A0AAV2J046_KNICA